MPEAETPPTVTVASKEADTQKKWSKEDIEKATDLNGVLEAFLGASKDRYADRVGLQSAVAERLLKLGETEKAFEFTVLAEQTENSYLLEKAARMNDENTQQLSRSASTFREGVENLQRSTSHLTQRLGEHEEGIRATSGRISETFRGGAEKIAGSVERAATKMSEAVDRISRAADRMGSR